MSRSAEIESDREVACVFLNRPEAFNALNMDMAECLATHPITLARSKHLLTDSFNSSFEAHIERERMGLSLCAMHPDGKEGLSAFIEKRKPTFFAK